MRDAVECGLHKAPLLDEERLALPRALFAVIEHARLVPDRVPSAGVCRVAGRMYSRSAAELNEIYAGSLESLSQLTGLLHVEAT
jgi:hypothetical protein